MSAFSRQPRNKPVTAWTCRSVLVSVDGLDLSLRSVLERRMVSVSEMVFSGSRGVLFYGLSSGCLLRSPRRWLKVTTAADQGIRCCNESVRLEFLRGWQLQLTDAWSHGAEGAEPRAGNGGEMWDGEPNISQEN
ncbi:unnamed protein product [Lota lota]